MDWVEKLTGETRGRLLRLVRRGASSIGDLAPELGISENAVRGHVAALERDGLLRPGGSRRDTGGKPARLYELSPEGEELFPKAYALAFVELLRSLLEEEGEAAVEDRLRRVGRRLGRRAAVGPAAVEEVGRTVGRAGQAGGAAEAAEAAGATRTARRERAETAARVLEGLGGAVEVVDAADGWVLRSAGCPLSRLVSEESAVCALAEALVAEVTGLPTREVCDRGDRPRCAFHVRGAGAAG